MNLLRVHLGGNRLIFKIAAIYPKKFKMSNISPYLVGNSHIHLHFQFHANPTNDFETIGLLKQNKFAIYTINLIGLGRKKLNRKILFFQNLNF